jgi:hypothetical protein
VLVAVAAVVSVVAEAAAAVAVSVAAAGVAGHVRRISDCFSARTAKTNRLPGKGSTHVICSTGRLT